MTATETLEVKVCALPSCGKEFTRNKRRPKSEFADRKYCSRTCGGKGQDKTVPRTPATHCTSGKHEMTEANTHRDTRGRRRCRACRRDRENEANLRRRAAAPPKPLRLPATKAKKPAPVPPPTRAPERFVARLPVPSRMTFRHYDPSRIPAVARPRLVDITQGAWVRVKW